MTNLPKHVREKATLSVSSLTDASALRGVFLALSLAGAACLGTLTAHAQSESAQNTSAQNKSTLDKSASGKSPVAVKVAQLRSVMIGRVHRVPAEVVSLHRSVIPSEVEGVLEQVDVQLGQVVLAGDVIAQVRSEDYELEFARIEAAISSVKVRIEQAKLRVAQANNLTSRSLCHPMNCWHARQTCGSSS